MEAGVELPILLQNLLRLEEQVIFMECSYSIEVHDALPIHLYPLGREPAEVIVHHSLDQRTERSCLLALIRREFVGLVVKEQGLELLLESLNTQGAEPVKTLKCAPNRVL